MSSKICSCCKLEKNISLFSKNRARKDGLHPSCKECKNKGNAKYHSKNRDKEAQYSRQYYKKIAKFEVEKRRELTARRRARKLSATPKWLSVQQLQEIKKKYALATMLTQNSGIVHAVDHIVPLKGKTVCGLHVPWNLQVITRKDNLTKSNKFNEEMLYA